VHSRQPHTQKGLLRRPRSLGQDRLTFCFSSFSPYLISIRPERARAL
jgi:hypothetical protein